nr:WG repeat-containing protein [Pseudomonas sp. BIGb0427]
MNTSGKVVLPFEYDGFAYNTWGGRLINDNLLSAAKEGKWGFIDLKGKVVLPYIYDRPGFFATARPSYNAMASTTGSTARATKRPWNTSH